ncbi:MAG TPA: hypothetical protein VHG91_08850 [Longimicrobium sp.]|nr:hypothetical protein [Longimicrobium sp.]
MLAKKTIRAGALVLALAACDGGGGGGGPTETPVPGYLRVTLDTPAADDRAMVVQLTGPGDITEVAAARGGHRVFTRAAGGGVRAAVFGSLTDGALLRFRVSDVAKASQYGAALVEVSDASHALRGSTGGYGLSVAKE